jgi:hypothetical protein
VGQRVAIFGTLTDADPLSLELDATEGAVRMLLTTLRGTVVALEGQDATAPLTMDLQSIDCHPIENFDFSGTGSESAADADPESYRIDTGTLDLSSLNVDGPVKVLGFVEPFGQAPPDFTAHSVVTVDTVPAMMKVDWHPPSGEAFSTLSEERLVLNLEQTGHFHHLTRGWTVTDLAELSQAPAVVPGADGDGTFVIGLHGTVQVFLEFDSFVEALTQWIDEGQQVHTFKAVGEFDDAAVALTAESVEVKLSLGRN